MKMETQKQKSNAFKIGSSWNTFEIEDNSLPLHVSPAQIKEKLSVFSEHYNVTSKFTSFKELICFELTLEDIPRARKLRKKKEVELKTRVYKVALAIEDSLMFCNRALSQALRENFAEALEANALVPIDLSSSPPYELLLLHRQAIKSSKNFQLQVEKMNKDLRIAKEATQDNLSFLDIGCGMDKIPQIRKVSTIIRNSELQSTTARNTKKIKLQDVQLSIESPSVFDLYIDLAKKNHVSGVPQWVTGCRKNGRTHYRQR